METVRVKSYAKLNLTLNITGVKDNFHMLDSVVTTVDMYDLISIKKRRDKHVSVIMHGHGSEAIPFESNNAVKAAESFIKAYGTCGADITVYKNIPMGLGVGGSSADAAGVLNGLSRLYGVRDNAGLKILADRSGSDTRYMLTGGYARLKGRGDEVKPIESRLKLSFLLLAPKEGVGTAECYKAYDKFGGFGGDSESAERAIISGDKDKLAAALGNSLMRAAESILPAVRTAYDELKSFNPLAVNMTGSGSGVYALFENADFCAYAKSRYRGKFAAYCLKTH